MHRSWKNCQQPLLYGEEASVPPFSHSITSSSSGFLRLSKNQKKKCLASTST
jgi:hypothetical protein